MTAVKLLSIISEGTVLKNNKCGHMIVVGKHWICYNLNRQKRE